VAVGLSRLGVSSQAGRPRMKLATWLGDRMLTLLRQPTGEPVFSVRTKEPVVALSFDDGPDPQTTPALLDILGRHGARATFFVVGDAAAVHHDVVSRTVAEGHAVGNHTWDHPDLSTLSPRQGIDQIQACAEALGGLAAPLFRPPYGRLPTATRRAIARTGYTTVKWNVSSDDWYGHDAEVLLRRVEPALRPGAIVLFHDGLYAPSHPEYADRGPTLVAVDRLLTEAGGRWQFVTIPELLQLGPPVLERDPARTLASVARKPRTPGHRQVANRLAPTLR
jgi:peptidoglycan-N-acetylglucosamine deacetylase